MSISIRLTAVVALLLMAIAWSPVRAQADASELAGFLSKVEPSEIVPGADRFGRVRGSPPVAEVRRGDERVGHVYLNSQVVEANGYSSKPIHILVGLDRHGTIVGVKLVAHSEPIVLIGIPERRVVDYLKAFIGYNPLRAAAEGKGPPHPDIVSGATVTVLVMGESIVRSAVRVARTLDKDENEDEDEDVRDEPQARGRDGKAGGRGDAELGGSRSEAASRVIDPGAGSVSDWPTLLKSGAVSHLHLTTGEVNKAFEESGNAIAARRPEPGPPDQTFIDLYAALVSQPAVGRSLLGDGEFASVAAMLAPGQHAVLIAGEGLYSFKGSGYVRGGIFDRIELIQGAETIRFRDHLHRRVGTLTAAGAPALREIGVFLVPKDAEFDPAAPWRLQLLVQRPTGALEKAFVSFELDYTLPSAYTREAASALSRAGRTAEPDAARDADAADGDEAARGLEPGDGQPLWQRIWRSKIAAIVVLGVMLAVLTAIFFFQDVLVTREKLYDRVRLAFLATTLVWLGWVAQAQLSVVNVLTFTTALRTDFKWSSFLVDPLVFILWCSVAVALLFWGRGPFCGWLCPFGALQEVTNRIARALKVPQFKIPWRVHERLFPIKYIIFLGLFGVSLGSLALAEVLSEIEPFKTAIILRFMREWWFVAFAVALLVAGLFIERFFCRYLCPLGAALAIPGRLRMFDWLRRYRECGNPCMRCFKECPVEAIHPEGHINPNECIGCLHCQMLYHHEHKCPVKIQRRLKRERRTAMAPGAPVSEVAVPQTTIPIHPASPA